jgi:hypothetical protein
MAAATVAVPALAAAGEGLAAYYRAKAAELEVRVAENTQNLRRLEAQRNELNARGACAPHAIMYGGGAVADVRTGARSLSLSLCACGWLAQCGCCGRSCSCCRSLARTWAKWSRSWARPKCSSRCAPTACVRVPVRHTIVSVCLCVCGPMLLLLCLCTCVPLCMGGVADRADMLAHTRACPSMCAHVCAFLSPSLSTPLSLCLCVCVCATLSLSLSTCATLSLCAPASLCVGAPRG